MTECIPLSPITRHFVFEFPELETYEYLPGQFTIMELPIHEEEKKRRRSYSIASRPDGSNRLEFAIVFFEGGAGTSYLFNQMKIGDSVPMSSAMGRMLLPDSLEHDICFISTGTGIAPFRSMLLDLVNHPRSHRRLDLVFGTRTAADMVYADEMRKLEQELENFHYHPTLSREVLAGCRQGYVHPVYQELYGDRPGREDALFYICGWGDMIRDARKNLAEMGFNRKQIHFESFG